MSTIRACELPPTALLRKLLASGRTRSWLMALPVNATAADERTRFYFGSAVVPRKNARSGKPEMGFAFSALLGFHRLYSRLLLRAARSRVLSGRTTGEW